MSETGYLLHPSGVIGPIELSDLQALVDAGLVLETAEGYEVTAAGIELVNR